MKISLIIAAYNVEKFIEKCVLSCYEQDINFSSFEIIVIDDGSTDTTALILKKLKLICKNIVIINQENSGLGAVRNRGILEARGELIWFIDGDDYIQKNILNEILIYFQNENLDALVLNYCIIDNKYQVLTSQANKIFLENSIVTGSNFYKYNFEKSYSCFFIFKKSLFINFDLYFKERINMQDSEILPKILLNVNRLAFLNKDSYYYVQHPDSFTNSTNGQKRFKYFESIIEVKKSLLTFLNEQAENNLEINVGVEKKIEGLQKIILNHLIYFKYEREWLSKIIKLLRENKLYPLQAKVKGKMKIIKIGINLHPILTKRIIDKLQFLRNK